MGTNCAPLVAYLFLFCYERDFMMSLQAGFNDASNATSRYLDDISNIDATLENFCTRTPQSTRGGCSRRVHKIE